MVSGTMVTGIAMMKRRWALSGSVALAALLTTAGAQAQSLSDSVRMTVQTNPKVLELRSNREEVDSELRRARSLYLPTIDMRSSIGPEWTDNLFTQGTNGQHIREELSVVLTQKLYDGGANDGRGRSSGEPFALCRLPRLGEFAIYRSRRGRGASRCGAAAPHARFCRPERGGAPGAGPARRGAHLGRRRPRGRAADSAQAMSRFEQAQAARDDVRGSLQDAEGRYLTIVGQAPGTLEDVPVPVGALPADVDSSVRIMISSNPTVKAREADVDAAKSAVELADSRFDPTVNLEVGGDHNHNVGGVPGKDNEARALVVLRWNLYAGGADIHNREAAYAQVAQARNVRLAALRQSEQDLRKTWAAYDAAQRRVPLLTSSTQHESEVRGAYDQQFEVSQRSLLDLLDAQDAFFQSEVRMVTAESQAVFAAYKILAIEGQLLQALNVPPPPEADPSTPARRPLRPSDS